MGQQLSVLQKNQYQSETGISHVDLSISTHNFPAGLLRLSLRSKPAIKNECDGVELSRCVITSYSSSAEGDRKISEA